MEPPGPDQTRCFSSFPFWALFYFETPFESLNIIKHVLLTENLPTETGRDRQTRRQTETCRQRQTGTSRETEKETDRDNLTDRDIIDRFFIVSKLFFFYFVLYCLLHFCYVFILFVDFFRTFF